MHRQQFTKLNVNVTKVASGLLRFSCPTLNKGLQDIRSDIKYCKYFKLIWPFSLYYCTSLYISVGTKERQLQHT